MRYPVRLLLGCLPALLAFPWALAHASAPPLLQHQALLTDELGVPLEGPVDLEFALFDQASGGAALWQESHAAVALAGGVAAVTLGGATAFPEDLFENPELWLEITVNTETQVPRQRLLSVAFALKAARAADLSLQCEEGDVLVFTGGAWGCGCAVGETRPCYSGPPGTEGVGACTGGVQTCSGGVFGECVGEVTPQPENCLGGVDEDCDAMVDEICAATCTQLDDPSLECMSNQHCAPDFLGGARCDQATGSLGQGEPCSVQSDCLPGSVCLANEPQVCSEWCKVGGDSCPPGTSCFNFAPALLVGAQQWGVCQ